MAEKIAVDVWMKITFPVNVPDEVSIETNMKDAGVKEVLTAWIQDNLPSRDSTMSKAEAEKMLHQNVYHVTLGVRLEDDTFALEHDCASRSMVFGILVDTLGALERGKGRIAAA